MIEQLELIDQSIVLWVNGLNTPFLDEFMWFISGKLTWFPLYLFLIVLAYKKLGTKGGTYFLMTIILVIAFTDLSAKYLFKEMFERYRPSHNLLLENKLHFYLIRPGDYYKGGTFGFVSSHAANFFGLATFYFCVFKDTYSKTCILLFFIGVGVAFSRIYLGVHYLSDVFVGALLGVVIAKIIFHYIWKKVQIKFLL